LTSQERIWAAIHHQESDFVPISPRIWAFLLGHYGSDEPAIYLKAAKDFDFDPILCQDSGLSNYFMNPIAGRPPFVDLEDVQVDLKIERMGALSSYQRTVHTPAGPLTSAYKIGRAGKEYGISPNFHHLEYPVKSSADLEKVKYLLPDPATMNIKSYFNHTELFGDQGAVFFRPCAGVDHFMADAFGLENLFLLYLDDHDFFLNAFQLFLEYYQSLLKFSLENGIKNIFESWYNFSLSSGWSPKTYRELVIPAVKANLELIHRYDGCMFFYDDGKMQAILPDLVALGVDLVETLTPPPIGDVDLRLAKEIARGKTCLKGNVDIVNVLLLGTPDLVETKVAELMAACKAGGGFILSTSDSIRDQTPVENVKRYFAAGRKYGKF
jgi:hypothetical protein